MHQPRTFIESILADTTSPLSSEVRTYALYGTLVLGAVGGLMGMSIPFLPWCGPVGFLKSGLVMYVGMFFVAIAAALFTGVVDNKRSLARYCLFVAALAVVASIVTILLLPAE